MGLVNSHETHLSTADEVIEECWSVCAVSRKKKKKIQ